MVAIRGRTLKKPWQRSCLSSKLKSSSAPIGREDWWCFHAVGSSNAPLLGSTAAEGLPRIGRTSIATHWRSCGLPQSASCSENFVIPPDVFGQTLIDTKYYADVLQSYHGRESFHSENLYQIFSYLKNAAARHPELSAADGMLLYPEVQHTLDASYLIQGHRTRIATVDLAKPWPQIADRMLQLVS